MARRKRGPLAELGRGLRKMTPNRVLARFASGGRHQTLGAIARAGLKMQAPTPRSIPMRPVPWGSPLPTSKASAAKSRTAAANKTTAAQAVIKQTARGKQVARRKAGGKFDGSYIQPADLSLYRQARDGRAVIQPGEPGRRRI